MRHDLSERRRRGLLPGEFRGRNDRRHELRLTRCTERPLTEGEAGELAELDRWCAEQVARAFPPPGTEGGYA